MKIPEIDRKVAANGDRRRVRRWKRSARYAGEDG